MTGFIAGDAVDPLDWDFTKYAGKGAKGTIAEPSQKAVGEFITVYAKAFPGKVGGDGKVRVDFEALSALTEAELEEQADDLLEAIVKLCSGKPTRAQIDKLPFRPKAAFIGWLAGKFLNSDPR